MEYPIVLKITRIIKKAQVIDINVHVMRFPGVAADRIGCMVNEIDLFKF